MLYEDLRIRNELGVIFASASFQKKMIESREVLAKNSDLKHCKKTGFSGFRAEKKFLIV